MISASAKSSSRKAKRTGRPFFLHAANGGSAERDDMMPFSIKLGSGGESSDTALGVPADADETTRHKCTPSNYHPPFFNLETLTVGALWSIWEPSTAGEHIPRRMIGC